MQLKSIDMEGVEKGKMAFGYDEKVHNSTTIRPSLTSLFWTDNRRRSWGVT